MPRAKAERQRRTEKYCDDSTVRVGNFPTRWVDDLPPATWDEREAIRWNNPLMEQEALTPLGPKSRHGIAIEQRFLGCSGHR